MPLKSRPCCPDVASRPQSAKSDRDDCPVLCMASSESSNSAVPSIGDIRCRVGCVRQSGAASGRLERRHSRWPHVRPHRVGTEENYNPFVAHAFYRALEASRSACPRTGWAAQHLIAKRGDEIVGVVPCYAKSHSRGEYVFDAAGPMPMSVPAAATIQSCRFRCRSRRRPALAFWCARISVAGAVRDLLAKG